MGTEALCADLVFLHADVRFWQSAVLGHIAGVAVHVGDFCECQLWIGRIALQSGEDVAHVKTLWGDWVHHAVLLLGDEDISAVIVGH